MADDRLEGSASGARASAGTCERRKPRPGDRLSLSECEDENASVLFVLEQNGKGVVVGRGPLSAATRTIDAMSDLDADVSMVVLPDEPSPTG